MLRILSCVLAATASLLMLNPSDACAQRPPVSWVNPDLPQGPGLTHRVLASKAMGHDVGYVVWTPADYDNSGKTRYPVIYVLHGMGGNEAADSAGFSGLVARAIRDGSVPPVICVFPNGGRSGYREGVEKMIIDELIPLIDKSYPTKAEAKSRAVAGFSMGGAGAVQFSLLHPELFCVAGSWGGGMWRGADALLAAAEKGADTLKGNAFSILLVNGDKDRPDAFTPLAEKLTQLKVEHQVVVLPDTPHNLGLYYQRAGDTMAQFLGKGLKN
ncbi:MAG TPA: alpha/beta hydrolase-fold protein [Thermoguttaceae bacterium]|nr:alpha/beta hydrolase-fold protein [Thermoguttaceae bacterium]